MHVAFEVFANAKIRPAGQKMKMLAFSYFLLPQRKKCFFKYAAELRHYEPLISLDWTTY